MLQSLSFNVQPGEMVALVGPSGAGKSTFFDLLQRFYDVDAGSIKLGGVDVREAKLQALRGAFGFVPQTPAMFYGTVRDNLTFGRPDASDEQVERSLSLANAQTFVNALPQGLLTPLGEDGIGLSGGQRQRSRLPERSLPNLHSCFWTKPPVRLMKSEQSIRKSVEALKGEMTILVIAHRLSTVRQADRILVFEEGRMIASGTHDELMKESDLYARFASIQFEG